MAREINKLFLAFIYLLVVQLAASAEYNQIMSREFIWGSEWGLDNPYYSYASGSMSYYCASAEPDFFYETPQYFQLWKKDKLTADTECIIHMLPAYRVILVPEATQLYIVTDILLAYGNSIYMDSNDSACQIVLKSIVWSMDYDTNILHQVYCETNIHTTPLIGVIPDGSSLQLLYGTNTLEINLED